MKRKLFLVISSMLLITSCGDVDSSTIESTTPKTEESSTSEVLSSSSQESTAATSSSSVIEKFTVTWKNYDGSVLETDTDVEKGTMPSFDGSTPTRDSTRQYRYTFKDWGTPLVPVTEDVTYTASYDSTLYAAKLVFDLDGGTTSSSTEDKYVESIDAKDFFFDVTKTDYRFAGWAYDNKVIFDKTGTKLMDVALAETMTFTARYSNTYTVTVNYESDKGSVTGTGRYGEGEQVTLSATSNEGYEFAGWYKDGERVGEKSTYTFTMGAYDVTLAASFAEVQNQNSLKYGSYPQTHVTDESIIAKLDDAAGVMPMWYNNQMLKFQWQPYNFYLSSEVTDYAYYQDIDLDKDGTVDYRGVYYTAYRPTQTSVSSSSSNQADNGYASSVTHWFKYEPIDWTVLSSENGQKKLIATNILDSHQYSHYNSVALQSKTDYKGDTAEVYPNNYKYSDIRTFLNTSFLSTAFTESEKNSIADTTVDNSAQSTFYETNTYASEDTIDKVFLLSYKEVIDRKSIDMGGEYIYNHVYPVTDYALCMGTMYMTNADEGYTSGSFWTRSPGQDNPWDGASVNSWNGVTTANYPINTTSIGVRPAIVL